MFIFLQKNHLEKQLINWGHSKSEVYLGLMITLRFLRTIEPNPFDFGAIFSRVNAIDDLPI